MVVEVIREGMRMLIFSLGELTDWIRLLGFIVTLFQLLHGILALDLRVRKNVI
jgi:hypothetical protein